MIEDWTMWPVYGKAIVGGLQMLILVGASFRGYEVATDRDFGVVGKVLSTVAIWAGGSVVSGVLWSAAHSISAAQ